MNRRSFFGSIVGTIAATAIGSRLGVKPPDPAEPPVEEKWGELHVQALMDDGSTMNWVIVNPSPGFYPGPYVYRDGTIEKVTSTLLVDDRVVDDPLGIRFPAMCVHQGDTIGLTLDKCFMSEV